MQKKWAFYDDDPKEIRAFAKKLNVSAAVASILWHRGIRERKAADRFLYPEEKQSFYDPFLMKDMELAAARIERAIREKEQIVIYGDYDVDGMTATAVLMRTLKRLGARVSSYIPDRQKEGYGFNEPALRTIAKQGADLLISVDCGISSVEDVEAVRDILDIVITDHHLPGPELPRAIAVVNPHREDCRYPFKDLAGVGVAFKLCQALWKQLRDVDFQEDLEIVALGTIADLVPLLGENRKLVRMGLERMNTTELPGLRALIKVAGLADKTVGAGQVGFLLAPRLNAAGRLDTASKGRDLLLSEDMETAERIAKELDDENHARQEIEQEILALAEKKLQELRLSGGTEVHSIVLSGEGWHQGVIGLVASRLVERYYLPTIVISEQGETAKGSCRSIQGLHMYEALAACQEKLLGFGGHSQAAGLTIRTEDIPAFRALFDDYVKEHLQEEDYVPSISIDFELSPQELELSLVEELQKLAPYGMGNPHPVFGCRDVRGTGARAIGRDQNHLMFRIDGRDTSIKVISWNRASYAPIVNREPLDIVYVPEINEWQGKRSVECQVEYMGPAKSCQHFPNRDMLAKVYSFLMSIQREKGNIPFDARMLTMEYSQRFHDISLYTMECALTVFEELGLLYGSLLEETFFMPPAPKEKLKLENSRLYRRHNSRNS